MERRGASGAGDRHVALARITRPAPPRCAVALVGILAGVGGLSGCGAAPPGGTPPPGRSLARAKCGACHPVPGPASLTAGQLDKVRLSHRRQARLSAPEWGLLREELVRRTASRVRRQARPVAGGDAAGRDAPGTGGGGR